MLRIHGNKFKHLAGLSYAGLAGSSAAFLLILAAMLFAPATAQPDVSAVENNSAISTYATTPTVGISLPTSINFADVLPTPSGATTTATADFTITTSDSTGYSLYLYSSDGDNSLRPKTSANTSTINATAGDVGLTLSSLKPNTWGYNLGTTTPNDTTTYSAVPTDNSTPIQTKDTSDTNSANDTYTLSFGAKVDSTIASGAYSNALTVAVVAEPGALTYIQDLTLSECQSQASDADLTVKDKRDDNEYTVRYINGACWMTQNLRLAGGQTLTSEESNIVGSWEFPSTPLAGSSYSYTDPQVTISSNTSYGGYYNYCAASAGTICNNTAQDAVQDICPKGWRMPSLDEMNGIIGYVDAFSPVASGYYGGGGLSLVGSSGEWWSSSEDGFFLQYQLLYNVNDNSLYTYDDTDRSIGISVRCIRSNPGTLTINFDGNGSTGGSTASQQIAAGNTAALNANGFTRSGYVFTGWNTAADGSGTSYTDGADYTVTPATDDATVTLYAQWEQLPTTMQDFTLAHCQQVAADGNYTLTDTRDNNSYTVRYINGACWMTQNLRLAGGTTLTTSDSNVTRDYTLPTTQLAGNSYSYTAPQTTISSNTSYGGYYNYCAASAGTVCSQTQANASQDICPKGWRLPTNSEQSGITGYVSAFSPVLSGYYYNGPLISTGSYGYWWSATAYNSDSQYSLYYNGSRLYIYSRYYKGRGYSVRCIRSS